MDNKESSKQLESRTKRFAIDMIKLSSELLNTPESKVIRYQVSKSGTSIGANYREANRSKSKADFINKIRICEGEASETVYWLEIMNDLNLIETKKVEAVLSEANELLAIFTSIGKNLKL